MCERVSATLPPTCPLPPQLTPSQNYKVYCTLHNIPIDESVADASAAADDMDVEMDVDEDDGAAMDEDEDEDEDMPAFFKDLKDADAAKEIAKTPSRNPKSKVALVVKAKVNKVLTATALADKRSRQCDQNDFLKLLLGTFACSWRRMAALTYVGWQLFTRKASISPKKKKCVFIYGVCWRLELEKGSRGWMLSSQTRGQDSRGGGRDWNVYLKMVL